MMYTACKDSEELKVRLHQSRDLLAQAINSGGAALGWWHVSILDDAVARIKELEDALTLVLKEKNRE